MGAVQYVTAILVVCGCVLRAETAPVAITPPSQTGPQSSAATPSVQPTGVSLGWSVYQSDMQEIRNLHAEAMDAERLAGEQKQSDEVIKYLRESREIYAKLGVHEKADCYRTPGIHVPC
jgi:hypothetical protein